MWCLRRQKLAKQKAQRRQCLTLENDEGPEVFISGGQECSLVENVVNYQSENISPHQQTSRMGRYAHKDIEIGMHKWTVMPLSSKARKVVSLSSEAREAHLQPIINCAVALRETIYGPGVIFRC